jgi:2,4-dienoyl-CoA reductase-like NADH-dependent reductase (Old Yellow Enzyme family)/thioredoxin reductase
MLKVLQSVDFGNITLRNRLVVPPMVTYLANADGTVNEQLIAYARTRAAGGFGLYILEATYVDRAGCGFSKGVGIDADDKLPGLKRLTDAVHLAGGKISVQLHHAGRETTSSLTGQTIVAPSDCPVHYSAEKVHELTVDEIADIVRKFGEAAHRAVTAGFDAIMLHGAHGYLLSQFLSPYTNKRTDAYGGTLENRLRISLEVIQAVRKAVGPDFPVSYRMSVEEGISEGLSLQESCKAASILSKSGINAIHVVAGNYDTNQLIIPPAAYGSMTNYARLHAIRDAVGSDFLLTVAGRITNVFQAEELISDGTANFVAMGRASLADPELPLRSMHGDCATVRTCIGCNDACIGRTAFEKTIGCAINPLTGRESEFLCEATHHPQKILIIGSGPAGMEAAWLAARRGHRVVLCEKESRLGGQFRLAAIPPYKKDIFIYLNHMKKRLEQENVDIRVSTLVNTEFLRKERPDQVILATGGSPIQIPFPGLDSIHHTTAQAVLSSDLDALGQNVVVIGGGMVGCETAEFIAESGRTVHVVEMMEEVVPGLFFTVREALLRRLMQKNVSIHTSRKVLRIEGCSVIVSDAFHQEYSLESVDSVVLALGVRPENSLEADLISFKIPYLKIGDAEKQGNCRAATQAALAACHIA